MKSFHDVVIRTGRMKLPSGTLFWHEAGKGDTLVFLHGSWQDSTQWLPLIQTLGADHHCLAPDLLGFGESSSAPLHSIALEVEALAGWLQALRIKTCVLVGHSLGAWVALRYSLQYPDQVKDLVLIEPEGLTSQTQSHRLDRWLTSPLSPLVPVLALSPLLSRLGGKATLQAWKQRRHTLRQSPAACQILFRRRAAAIAAERVDPLSLGLAPTLLIADPKADPTALTPAATTGARHWPIPPAANDLGLDIAATAQALRLCRGQFPRALPTPDRTGSPLG